MSYSLWLVSDRTQDFNGQPDLCWCWTYAAHQSRCRCRRPPEPSRSAGSSGTSSICLPDFAGRPCHSDWKQKEPRFEPCGIPRLRQSGISSKRDWSPCRAGRCASRWTSPAPGPPPPSHGRRKTPCRHQGFRFPGPRKSRQTLVLEGTGSGSRSDFSWNGDFTYDCLHDVTHGPFSQRESCCSVRMDGRLPMLLKMVKSLPIRSVATPAYSSSPRKWRQGQNYALG